MGSHTVAAVWVSSFLIAVATIPLVLRVLSRRIGQIPLWWDDWLALAAWPFSIAISAVFLAAGDKYGFGSHGGDPTFFLHVLYFSEIWYNIAIALSKFSVLCFYYRIFETKPGFTRQLQCTAVFVLLWVITFVMASILQCVPVPAYWNPKIPAVCVDKFAFFMGQAVPNIILDFVLLVLPLRPLWSLNMKRPQRYLLLFVFILGYLNPIVSIVRITSFIELGHKTGEDINYNFSPPALWSAAEVAVAIFSSSVPSLTHLYRRVIFTYRKSQASVSTKVQHWTRGTRNARPRGARKLWGTSTIDLITNADDAMNPTLSGRGTQHVTAIEPSLSEDAGPKQPEFPMDQIHVRRDVDITVQSHV